MNVPVRHRALVAGALSLLCLTALWCYSTDLHAQTPDLTGKEIVVTPFRSEMDISRSGSAITVIRADEIQKWGAQTLADDKPNGNAPLSSSSSSSIALKAGTPFQVRGCPHAALPPAYSAPDQVLRLRAQHVAAGY
jgi:hypothetical protein